MNVPIRVLHLEDNPNDADLVKIALDKSGMSMAITCAANRAEFLAALKSGLFDLILADYQLLDLTGMEALALARANCPETPLIFVTGSLGEEASIETLKQGAVDYVLKERLGRLVFSVRRAMHEAEEHRERQRAEAALRTSKQLLERTLNSLCDAVFILSANSVEILECNPAATEMFGYSRQEMLGRTTTFLHIDEVTLQEFRKHLYSAIQEKGFLHQLEFRMKRRDGTVFPTEHSVLPLEDETANRTGWVSVVRDITERKQAEAERERLITELQETLAKNKILSGLLPICSACKKIRDNQGQWHPLETYIQRHSEASFSHGLCPDCLKRLYPDLNL
jgi:PAS domain S-box-containing protein